LSYENDFFGRSTDMTALAPAGLWLVACYLVGSLPTGYLLGRFLKGIDIRQVGSRNPGATNVFRSVGKTAGIATLLIDIFKGWVVTWLSLRFFPGEFLPLLGGLAAVAGHSWSPFLSFRGGKGVATSAGVFFALLPTPTLAALTVFAVVFGLSHYVSAGSLAGAVALPSVALWLAGWGPRSGLALLVAALIVVKHIPNIRRLLKGEELAVRFTHEEKKP